MESWNIFLLLIIVNNQAAFIQGRSISDCVAIVNERVQIIDRKVFGGNVGLKLDIKKAFDSINWDFLLEALYHFDFHNSFINWVKIDLHSAHLSSYFS